MCLKLYLRLDRPLICYEFYFTKQILILSSPHLVDDKVGCLETLFDILISAFDYLSRKFSVIINSNPSNTRVLKI